MAKVGRYIDVKYDAEDFTGYLGELLADHDEGIPDHIRNFLQDLYQISTDAVFGADTRKPINALKKLTKETSVPVITSCQSTDTEIVEKLKPFVDPNAKPLTEMTEEDWYNLCQRDKVMDTINSIVVKYMKEDLSEDELRRWGIRQDGFICLLEYDYDCMKKYKDKQNEAEQNLRRQGLLYDGKHKVTNGKRQFIQQDVE